MITYVYIVKCPHCDDEHFDFFDEAKDYALCCVSKRPTISQVEVDRNDFGECTDSCDLGTVWSWEDALKERETDAEPETSIFTKDDFADFESEYNPDNDPEFYELDNSVEVSDDSLVDDIDNVPDNFRKPIPEGMTIEELVETMEENEDTVECSKCGGLFEKASCTHNKEGFGWCCEGCSTDDTEDTLVEDSLDYIDDEEELEIVDDEINVNDFVICHCNNKIGRVLNIKGDVATVEFTGGKDPDRIDTYYLQDLELI